MKVQILPVENLLASSCRFSILTVPSVAVGHNFKSIFRPTFWVVLGVRMSPLSSAIVTFARLPIGRPNPYHFHSGPAITDGQTAGWLIAN